MTVDRPSGRPLALVTGASSGIGRELARLAARDGYDVVLVARRSDRLAVLAAELADLGVSAVPVAADLAEPGGVPMVVAALPTTPVDVLVNDAGVGGAGRFAVERDLAADLAMIQLNVTSLVHLTGLLLPSMMERRRGGILNVASIAGYVPGVGQAVYNATKAFVKSFSQAITEETRGTGVRVTTLCPGPVVTEYGCCGVPRSDATRQPADESDVRVSGGRRGLGRAGGGRGRTTGPDLRAHRCCAPHCPASGSNRGRGGSGSRPAT